MKRARLLRRAALATLLLFLVSTPALGQSPEVPGQFEGTTEDAFNIQARYYAELAGISVEDAKQRMELQEDASTLNWMLERNAGNVLGGFSIEDHPYVHVKVMVVAGGEDRVQPYIDESPLRDIVEIEIVERTLEELRQEHDHVVALLEPLDLFYQSEIWGQREVRITVEDVENFQQQLRDAEIELPDSVVVVEDPDGIFRPDASVIGGW